MRANNRLARMSNQLVSMYRSSIDVVVVVVSGVSMCGCVHPYMCLCVLNAYIM